MSPSSLKVFHASTGKSLWYLFHNGEFSVYVKKCEMNCDSGGLWMNREDSLLSENPPGHPVSILFLAKIPRQNPSSINPISKIPLLAKIPPCCWSIWDAFRRAMNYLTQSFGTLCFCSCYKRHKLFHKNNNPDPIDTKTSSKANFCNGISAFYHCGNAFDVDLCSCFDGK